MTATRRGIALAIALLATLSTSLFSAPASATDLGEVIDHGTFTDGGDNDGVDDRYRQFADFSASEYQNWTNNGYQFLRIGQDADNNGDASMSKDFGGAAQEIYKAQAWVRTTDFSWPFRARLTIHFWNASRTDVLDECNATNLWSDSEFHLLEFEGCRAPYGTGIVNLAIRANNKGCDYCVAGAGWGTVTVDRLRLVRTG